MTSEPGTAPIEVSFEVDGLTYAGLSWGEPGLPVVLALHGWLDNALSFHRLGPLLHGYQVIALDLSGHGLSSHRGPDATYNLWDDVPQLVSILESLDAPSVSLIGHSRGAAIAILLASVLQEHCQHLVVIDGFLTAYMDNRNAAENLRKFVRERQKYRGRGDRYFASVDEFIERRQQYGFSDASAIDIVDRALEQGEAGYRLRNDPRLFGASALWFDESHRLDLYASITAPMLAVVAESGLLADETIARAMLEQAGSVVQDFKSTTIAGSHHLHMEEGSANLVAQRINQFLDNGQ